MNDSVLLTLLSLVLSFLTIVFLVILLVRAQAVPTKFLSQLLREQQLENQKLRNQLRSGDVVTLNGLNYSTLPPETTGSNSDDILNPVELAQELDDEDLLAQEGFTPGELTHDLTSAGWSPPYRNRDGDTFL